MISQAEALRHSGVDVSGYTEEFSSEEMAYIAEAEYRIFSEWEIVCESLKLRATDDEVPENYNEALYIQGSWGGKRYPRIWPEDVYSEAA